MTLLLWTKKKRKYISYIIMIGKNQKLRQRWVIKYQICKALIYKYTRKFSLLFSRSKVNAVVKWTVYKDEQVKHTTVQKVIDFQFV